jgi:AraC-like DNA-binding protein
MAGGFGLEYRVIEAADNKQALEQARQMVPDLIISEITPPRTDGLELCRSLKADELASHIPVIVVTTDVSEKLQIQALEAGADDYLIRPFTQTLLRARAENLLRSRRMLHEHFNHELALQPREVAATQADAHFLRRAIQTVEKHLPDFEFDVDLLAQRLALSRRQLFRKLKAVTGCTPHAFIRALRLKRAAQLLKQSALTVTEITYAVGFSDLKHFRTVFREQFGVLPGEYAAHSNGAEQMPDPRPTAADLPSKALL